MGSDRGAERCSTRECSCVFVLPICDARGDHLRRMREEDEMATPTAPTTTRDPDA